MAETTNPNQESVERTIAFADIAGYTSLTEAHGDLVAADTAERFAELANGALRGCTRLVKTLGDAVLLVADDPGDAIESLIALWERLNRQVGFPAASAGLHHGTAIQRDGDYYGSGVNVAARLAEHAQVGQILCSRDVAEAAERAELAPVASRSHQELRGIPGRIEIFELFPGEEPTGLITDPVCRMRVTTASAQAMVRVGEETFWFCSPECANRFLEGVEG